VDQSVGPAALILLVIPAIALRIAMRALYGPQRQVGADPMQTLLSLASTILFVLAVVGLLIGLFGFWVLLILLPIVVPMVINRVRHSQHRALVWALASAAERGIPLSEAARAYADETQGDTGVRALALAEAIERGEPLSNAVRAARLRMGSAIKLAVRMGEQLGVLGPAMRQQLRDSQQVDAALRDVIGRFVYLCIVVFALLVCGTFMMLKIVPVYQRILQEFDSELPPVTSLVIRLANQISGFGGTAGTILLSAITLLTIPLCIYIFIAVIHFIDRSWPVHAAHGSGAYTASWTMKLMTMVVAALLMFLLWPLFVMVFVTLSPLLIVAPIVLQVIGWFPRDLPVVWRLFKRYDGALVMRGLALAVRRGVPLPQAMGLVADCYPVSIVSRLVLGAAVRVAGGMNWCDSLRQTGLISQADAAVFASAERVGNLAWALEEMADSALRRQIYRVQAALQLMFPIVLLALGGAVLVFVVGFFLPLVSLIQGLA
jgi:type II secretory pathway component PulF